MMEQSKPLTDRDAKKKKRLAYEPPRAIRLDALHQGVGACTPFGSGDNSGGGCTTGFNPGFSKCQPGSSASGSKCDIGEAAGGNCLPGISPVGQCNLGSIAIQ
jgi:hypothetical protein